MQQPTPANAHTQAGPANALPAPTATKPSATPRFGQSSRAAAMAAPNAPRTISGAVGPLPPQGAPAEAGGRTPEDRAARDRHDDHECVHHRDGREARTPARVLPAHREPNHAVDDENDRRSDQREQRLLDLELALRLPSGLLEERRRRLESEPALVGWRGLVRVAGPVHLALSQMTLYRRVSTACRTKSRNCRALSSDPWSCGWRPLQ